MFTALKFLEDLDGRQWTLFQSKGRRWLEGQLSLILWDNTESLILFLKWGEGGTGVLEKGRKQEMCCLPELTVKAGAPFSEEFGKLLFVGENGAGGGNCRYRS